MNLSTNLFAKAPADWMTHEKLPTNYLPDPELVWMMENIDELYRKANRAMDSIESARQLGSSK